MHQNPDIESLPCYPSIAELAAAFIERWFTTTRERDPWLRWMIAPRFEDVCRAIWTDPDGFMEQFLRMRTN